MKKVFIPMFISLLLSFSECTTNQQTKSVSEENPLEQTQEIFEYDKDNRF